MNKGRIPQDRLSCTMQKQARERDKDMVAYGRTSAVCSVSISQWARHRQLRRLHSVAIIAGSLPTCSQ